MSDTQATIREVCAELSDLLVKKNIAYGDSAINPCRVMSKASATEQIMVRIDDKLNRVMQGSEFPGDDTIKDLAGYFVLLMVARKIHGD